MKLRFKHQKFQADAAKAVCDVFAGQPCLTPAYMMDRGYGQLTLTADEDFTGFGNARVVPGLNDNIFVAETKGSMSSMQLRLAEVAKIQCAREHFRAISSEGVVYDNE
jgi:type III restriction enzyme